VSSAAALVAKSCAEGNGNLKVLGKINCFYNALSPGFGDIYPVASVMF
jgi:hypothetical protein